MAKLFMVDGGPEEGGRGLSVSTVRDGVCLCFFVGQRVGVDNGGTWTNSWKLEKEIAPWPRNFEEGLVVASGGGREAQPLT